MKFTLFFVNAFVIFLALPPSTITQYNPNGQYVVENKSCQIPYEQVCHSVDDPHLTSFDGKQFEFQREGRFNLYNDFDTIKVDAEYCRCSQWETATCNCAVHITYKGQYEFLINSCRVSPKNLKFYYKTGLTCREVDCSAKRVPGDNQCNDAWWYTPGNAVQAGNEFFCATSQYDNSVVIVRTNNPDPSANIYVQFNLGIYSTYAFGISGVHIKPAPKYKYRNGGICGLWDGNQANDNQYVSYSRRKRDVDISDLSFDEVTEKYKLPEPCLCDPDGTTQCSMPLAKCLAQIIKSPVEYNVVISLRKNVANPISRDEAMAICDKYIDRETFQKAVDDGHIASQVLDTAYSNCIIDSQHTGDRFYAIVQNERVRATILANSVDLENNPPPYLSKLTDPIEKRIPDFHEIANAGSYEYQPPAGCPEQP